MANGFKSINFKEDEIEELDMMARRQGYKSIREMVVIKLGMRYEDGRKTPMRGAGIEPASIAVSFEDELSFINVRHPVFAEAMQCR